MAKITITIEDKDIGAGHWGIKFEPSFKELMTRLGGTTTAAENFAAWAYGEIWKEYERHKKGQTSPIIIPKAHRMW